MLEGFHHVEGALEVGVQHGVPVFVAHAQQQAVAGDTGVVHQDVRMAEVGEHLLAQLGGGGAVGNVHGVAFGSAGVGGVDGFGHGLRIGLGAADHRHFGTLRGEAFCHGLANSPASAGNYCDFVLKCCPRAPVLGAPSGGCKQDDQARIRG